MNLLKAGFAVGSSPRPRGPLDGAKSEDSQLDLSLLRHVSNDFWLLLQEPGRSVDNNWYGIILILLFYNSQFPQYPDVLEQGSCFQESGPDQKQMLPRLSAHPREALCPKYIHQVNHLNLFAVVLNRMKQIL